MISKIKHSYKSIFTFLGLICLLYSSYCQTSLEKEISIQFENISLIASIKKISEISAINFSYNPSIIPKKTINKSFKNQSVKYILSNILSGLNISFVELSGQVILFQSDKEVSYMPMKLPQPIAGNNPVSKNSTKKSVPIVAQEKKEKPTPDPEPKPVPNDTVFVNHYDTVFLTRFDTVIQIRKDTVFIEKTIVDTLILFDSTTIFDKIYSKMPNEKKTWFSAGLLYSYQPIINYKITDSDNRLFSESLSERLSISGVRAYSVSANFNLHYNQLLVQSGIEFSQLSQQFDHINETINAYNRNDTIETYYTVQNSDTNWIYVTEPNWIETSEIIRNTAKVNVSFIQIPLMLGYNARYKNFSFELSAGVKFQVPLQNKVSVYFDTTNFNYSETNSINNLELKTRNPSYSYSVALSVNYLLNKNLCFVVRPYYCGNISSIYANREAIEQKNNYGSIAIGMRYYFFKNSR
ncbi:MAG: outer membrane beta-barrel protein [Bacteroidales bacterium]|nr:outer membrane beta-barrel protein [Bacteroidales bacterium]MBN2817540.1 outer membrane beta-barrel protein [Bacteroidales bacterium]